MEFTKLFKELGKEDVAIAGGKGASLGEMINAGISVPDGYVVLSNAFEQFIKETDLNVEIDAILDTVKHEEVHTVEEASEKIQSLILNAEMPKDIEKEILNSFDKLGANFVAVRSSATSEDSATAAWAGQLDSYLNTTKKELLENVKRCWASLFTPRAIFYRFEKKLHETAISVAVVVQKMVNSEESGIAFSVHPVTQDYNQLIIEAGFGLGEAIVQGSITPDSYVVDKQDWHIIDINVNEQSKGLFRKGEGGNEWKELGKKGREQVLNEREIIELAKLIVKIEKHYGFPVDIEWAKEKGKFYIVQSRPITTLTNRKQEEKWKKYSKLVHLDLPLSLVELHYEQESASIVPWTKEKFSIAPYIFYERKNNLTYLFYDVKGVEWQMRTAGQYEKEEFAINKIREKYGKIKEIIEKEKSLDKKEILDFLENLREIWPWLNYMWWAIEYKDKNKESVENLTKIRKYTEHFTPGIISVFKKSLGKIYPEKKKYVNVILLKELEDDKIPEDNILKNRLNYYVYTDNKLFESTDEIFNKYNIQVVGGDKNKGDLNGQTAYPGKVKGKVFLIHKREDIRNFKEGNILVASTTTPDYLPAMKKSSAIISEHGGAICHAAITSRELKIPCVVGVDNITNILKNGDLIEVDADNGIIKRLSRDEINPEDYFFLETVPGGYPMDVSYINLAHIMAPKTRYGIDAGSCYLVFEKGGYAIFLEKERWFGSGEKILERTLKDKKIIDEWENKFKQWLSELSSARKHYTKINFSSLPNDEIYEELEKIISIEMRNGEEDAEAVSTNYGTNLIYQKLEKVIKEIGFEPNKTAQVLLRATGIFPLIEYEKEIGQLALLCHNKKITLLNTLVLEKNKELSKLVSRLLENYGWLDASLVNPPKPIESVLADVNDLLNFGDKIKEILEEREKERKQKKIEKAELLKKVLAKSNKDQQKVIHFAITSAELGRILVDEIMQFIYHRRKIYTEIGKRLRISEIDVKFMSLKEIKNCLLNNKNFEIELINERKNLSVCFLKDAEVKIYSGEEAQKIKNQLFTLMKGDDSPLKGEIAFSKGKVKGTARLVRNAGEMSKVKQGDVLVSSRTYPDLLPAMKKSIAIIAELGGLLSHAAIVSRELHIPCIVGVRNAMSRIKDGDSLELDTERGTIKILEKEYNLRDYRLYFEADGLNLLIIDIIRRIAKEDDFMSIVREGKLDHYIGRDVLKTFLSRIINLCSDKKSFSNFVNKFISIKNNIEVTFENVMKDLRPNSYQAFLNSLKEIIKFYLVIDFDITNEDEEKIKKEHPYEHSKFKEIGQLKNRAREVLNKAILFKEDYLKQVVGKIAKVYGTDKDFLFYYKEEELTNLVKKGIKISQKEIEERMKASIVLSCKGQIYYFFGDDALNKISEVNLGEKQEKEFLKGGVAYKSENVVIGKAMIFRIDFGNLRDQIKSFLNKIKNQGGKVILVTGATSPEMTPIFGKISAIVTDQGGLNAHAAIISREMKIPCIVGTKNATKILKDGDEIEVDTNTGVVTILKKSS